ncbi:peptidase inhibitor family I36 protein [Nocardia pseudobrasiliensis]|uniref:Peptidase inhibitor family I36 n=1 Tax=Nocardia pseudobrasiliensis TaxID=45979 RepID=A0A370HWA5_9NOCA|nr:peptidase inhibitor family I36 protein [Nocardia pseudobrasiliensis]RDI62793.1 peptidase inhibitor family I36 [Nocardia pseudobrasiliensis]
MRWFSVLALAGAMMATPTVTAVADDAAECPGLACVWSGANYTGTRVVLTAADIKQCHSAQSLGLNGIRSAIVDGEAFDNWSYLSSDTCQGAGWVLPDRNPSFDPPVRSLYIARPAPGGA